MARYTVLVFLCLSACGLAAPENSGPAVDTAIEDYSVGVVPQVTDSSVPIRSGGEFTVRWRVRSSDPYTVRLFVSFDQVLDEGDPTFFLEQCSSLDSLYRCDRKGQFECQFSNGLVIRCGEQSDNNPGRDLGGFIRALPQDGFILLEACNGLRSSCPIAGYAVRFY